MFKKILLLFTLLFNLFVVRSQISVGGGLNSVAAFGVKTPYMGINILGEYRQDDMAYFAKFYSTLSQKQDPVYITMEPVNQDDSISLNLEGNLTYGYNVLEFGKRQYYAKDLDFGPAVFFSSHFALMMNSVGIKTNTFDANRFKYPSGFTDNGKIFGLAIGLNAGTQYSFYYGTYYVDFGLNYLITYLPNNYLASNIKVNQLTFAFNLGFKKTIFSDY